MAKKIGIFIVVLVMLLVVLSFAKNIIAKTILSSSIKTLTGLGLQIRTINIGILKTLVDIQDLKILNPQGFPEKVMVDVPNIFIDYDLSALLKKKIHLNQLKLNLKELIVVQNEKGQLNLDSLKVARAKKEKKPVKKPEKTKMPDIQIDELRLKIGKVIYKDYLKAPHPAIREFKVNIDERYENITDPRALVNLVVVKALTKTTISSLVHFDLWPFKKETTEIFDKTTGALGKGIEKTADETVEKVAEELKKLLPFGQ